ncbi:hypothetical protein [Rhodopseudomonas sp. BR0G17]|uniref:hypothetical protein n=1 Tax=Rhodopseudomonas sp. BR0G17 TaxID=2269368 RepID=UPI0013DFE180|nr:hypothetical protein [Rhodopseudomonas sp. BR0G17]NEW95491.1 hypothetical protein [Rhodopseudomonas sp. BR0G17]
MSARAARLPRQIRDGGTTLAERVATLEQQQVGNDERADKQGEQLVEIQKSLQRLLAIVERLTGIKMLFVALLTFVGTMAATVGATIAVIRYLTGS